MFSSSLLHESCWDVRTLRGVRCSPQVAGEKRGLGPHVAQAFAGLARWPQLNPPNRPTLRQFVTTPRFTKTPPPSRIPIGLQLRVQATIFSQRPLSASSGPAGLALSGQHAGTGRNTTRRFWIGSHLARVAEGTKPGFQLWRQSTCEQRQVLGKACCDGQFIRKDRLVD